MVKKEKKGARARFDWEADFEQQHGSLQDAAAFKSFDAVFPEMKGWRNDVPRSGHANVKGLRGCNFRRCRAEDEDGEAVRARVVELGGGKYLYQLGRSVQPGGDDDDEGGDDDDDDDDEKHHHNKDNKDKVGSDALADGWSLVVMAVLNAEKH